MLRATLFRFLGAVLLTGLTACSTRYVAPVTSSSPGAADGAWERVLERAVDSEGRVDFKLVAEDKKDLETYVDYVSRVSPWSNPELFPTKELQLAFYINSYNALAMYGVVRSGIPKDFDSQSKRADFFYFTSFLVGGKEFSLYEYENEVIRKLGEPRVHFALNCMSIGCPRLPQEPFTADDLSDQLDSQSSEFFNSDKYVQVAPEKKSVALSEILKFYTDDFVREGGASSLIDYVNRYRRSQIPPDYTVTFIPYDWKVNAIPSSNHHLSDDQPTSA